MGVGGGWCREQVVCGLGCRVGNTFWKSLIKVNFIIHMLYVDDNS